MISSDNCFAMKILLTGATGFLGINVTRVLAEAGHELRVSASQEQRRRAHPTLRERADRSRDHRPG